MVRNPKWRSMYVSSDGEVFDTDVSGPSMTRQEFAEECDINTIMKKYGVTGLVSHLNPAAPRYLDAVDIPNLMDALNIMNSAGEAFMSLPAKVRREFDNDAARFVEFASDKANLPKLREWGLAPPEKAPEAPMRVEVVNPLPAVEPVPKAP